MNCPSQKYLPSNLSSLLLLFLCVFAALLAGCVAAPAKHDGMIPTTFETVGKHSKTVSVSVQGGRETKLLTSTQISDEAFTQALADSITKSPDIFARCSRQGRRLSAHSHSLQFGATDVRPDLHGQNGGWLDTPTCR